MNVSDVLSHYLSSPLGGLGFLVYSAEQGKKMSVQSIKEGIKLYGARLDLYTLFLRCKEGSKIDFELFTAVLHKLSIKCETELVNGKSSSALFLHKATTPDMEFETMMIRLIMDHFGTNYTVNTIPQKNP